MNRRTFLKITGATLAVVAIPATAKTEPKWINFTEEMPKVGQKVALFTYFDGNSSANICTGIVMDKNGHSLARQFEDDTICVMGAISHSFDGFFGEDVDTYVYNLCGMDRAEAVKKITKAKWMKRKIVSPVIEWDLFIPRHGREETEYIGRSAAYWTLIEDYIPENLPKFPKKKHLTFVEKNGKLMLIKK